MRALAILFALTSAPAFAADADSPHPHQGVAQRFTDPKPSALTPDEQAKLVAGESVRKQVRYEDTNGGRGIAIMDVAATPERVWEVILDFPSYSSWVDNLESCAPYARNGNHILVAFVLSGLGFSVEYFIDHTYQPDKGTMSWTLDYSRKSDLDDSTGYWLVYDAPGHPGHTRVEYTVDVRVAGWVPSFVEDLLAKKGLEQATTWVKQQAEK